MKPLLNAAAWMLAGLAIGLVLSMVFVPPPAAVPIQNATAPTQPQANETGELPGPQKPEVDLIMIEAPGCDECNAGGYLLTQAQTIIIQTDSFEVDESRTIQYPGQEASALVSEYNITELPALIITGDTSSDPAFIASWTDGVGSLESDGALVTRLRYPPFYDIENGTVVGLVEGLGIRATGCLECGEPLIFISSLEGPEIGMAFSNKTVYDENDSEAQELIAKYNITKLPVLLLKADQASEYPVFGQLETLGSVEEDGWYVLRDVAPPYIDLAANRTLRGLVTSVHIVNSSCAECFDIAGLSAYIEQQTGLVVVNQSTYEADSSEGAALISKYNITAIPTVIYSPDVSYYPRFEEIWTGQENTVEEDGWFVFRDHAAVGVVYQNVS
ncbi:MAG: hypothetical protein AB1324_06955, partial [Candidatus Micrarchaeota archaeon]